MNTLEKELILKGLYRDREELAAKLNDVDKLIRKVKTGVFNLNSPEIIVEENKEPELTQTFPANSNLKVQILFIFDLIGVACRLKDVQEKYKELTGINMNIRETLRTLNKHELLKLLRPKNTERGLYWVKTSWLENNNTTLKDEHKFQGFELLYSNDRIEFV
jgi:hypothetical protein